MLSVSAGSVGVVGVLVMCFANDRKFFWLLSFGHFDFCHLTAVLSKLTPVLGHSLLSRLSPKIIFLL